MPRVRPTPLALLVAVVACLGVVPGAAAQVRPDLPWRTIETAHFRIHFPPALEPLARRTARNAEEAWRELASELVPPRGPIEVVLLDEADYANGFATPFPFNRIVLHARPPVDEFSLRGHPDWNKALVTHELAHVFHLDRARGWWRAAQAVFGRAAPFFPNTYAPAWIIEGLAVHYETRFGGGGGRLASTEPAALVRAQAAAGALPALDALSLAAPHFPRGNHAYLYGAFAITHPEPRAIRTYVELASGRIIPWRQDANARDAFGASFTRRWEAWRDSVLRAGAGSAGADAATVLTTHPYTARFPRFLDDTTLLYVGEDGRRTTALHALGTDGTRRRLARRIGTDAHAPMGDGSILGAEFEYRGPYTIRSDLRVTDGPDAAGGPGRGQRAPTTRRTEGARLSHPDVHPATGRIVAVQSIPGSTRLVLLDGVGAEPRELAAGSFDLTWSEPRWSHDGRHVAAARWEAGGRTSIVVLDVAEGGRPIRTFAPRRPAPEAAPPSATPVARDGSRAPRLPVVTAPAWIPGDAALLFASDHEGRAMIYRGEIATGAVERVWTTATALSTPDVSPDGRRMVAVELAAAGYRIVMRDLPAAGRGMPQDAFVGAAAEDAGAASGVAGTPAGGTAVGGNADADPAAAFAQSPARPYSPWRSLLPRWWLPTLLTDGLGTNRFGAMSSGRDAVERHAWALSAAVQPDRSEWSGSAVYQYAGLGNPVLSLAGSQDWAYGVVRDTSGAFRGHLARQDRDLSLQVTVLRPRVRNALSLTLAGEYETFAFRTYPASLLPTLSGGALRGTFTLPAVAASVGWSTLQRPALAVSAEDGVSVSMTQRRRFDAAIGGGEVDEAVGSLVLTKSVPFLPGYARHVLALRGAVGVTGHRATTGFGAGGVSGGSLELVPTVVIGDPRRTFFVRGFPADAQRGVRAAAASAEWRAPLFLVGRGYRFLPVFVQKASVTAFADAGEAWCEFAVSRSFLCAAPLRARTPMVSYGAEFALDAAVDYDAPYRFRFGVARPTHGRADAARATSLYFTIGGTF